MRGSVRIIVWSAGIVVVVPVLVVLYSYFFFRPMGKTPVNLTVVDAAHRPVANATLKLLQSGERGFIPIPFAPTRRVKRPSEEHTDQQGFCRFYVTDQRCELTDIIVSGQSRRMLRYTDYRTGHAHTEENPRPSWLLAARPYEYKVELTVQ